MSSTASSRTSSSVFVLAAALLAGCAGDDRAWSTRYSDDFADTRVWVNEAEQPARVSAQDGALDIDSPAGITLWFRHELRGDVRIEFEATAIAAGGPNDQVSDLNVFWMARNADGTAPVYAKARNGRFAEYDDLRTYYVGLGGNRNTTSRFRRYVGEPGNRPLRPEHDLSARSVLLVPNRAQTIVLIAAGPHVEFRRDGRVLFTLEDPAPYTSGWFAIRTTWSHLRIRHLRIAGRGPRN
jgi:hypothetical protein